MDPIQWGNQKFETFGRMPIGDTQCFKIFVYGPFLIDSAMDLDRNPDLAEDTIPSDSEADIES